MYFIDRLAYCSSLRKVNPNQKFIFSLFTILMVLLARNYVLPVIVILLMTFILIKKGGISLTDYGKALLIPLFFLAMGMLSIMLQLELQNGLRIYSTRESFCEALFLTTRAFAAIISLYFFILNTPMVDLLQLLKRYKCPILIRELMFLMYRFIMLLGELSAEVILAQKCRGGYTDVANSRKSLSQLISCLFLGLHHRSQGTHQGLMARGYYGEIDLLPIEYEAAPKIWWWILITQVGLGILLII